MNKEILLKTAMMRDSGLSMSELGSMIKTAFIALFIIVVIVMLFMMLIELLLWLKDVDGREERGTGRKQLKMGIAVIVMIIAPFILLSGIQFMIDLMFT